MTECCLETKCFQCCKETNMLLSYHDIENIQKLGYDREFFVKEHNGWLQLKNNKDNCVFHNNTYCTIYEQRPEGCTLYPVVYDNDNQCEILDSDCPQKQCFLLSKEKTRQLYRLITLLQKERTERKKDK